MFGFLEIALSGERVAEFEQTAGGEVFKLLGLRKGHGLLSEVFRVRDRSFQRGGVTQLDQRGDLLRFVADGARGFERLPKLRFRLLVISLSRNTIPRWRITSFTPSLLLPARYNCSARSNISCAFAVSALR